MPGMIQPQRGLVWADDGKSAMVSVRSLFSDKVHVRELRMTREQYNAWQEGAYIQDALSHLTPDEREFLMTGATPEEWDVEFHADEDADYIGKIQPGPVPHSFMDWSVTVGGEPLNPRNELRNHSPDGFCWGYNGSGPAQLALAILADALGDAVALKLYQRFKDEVVYRWPQHRGWRYSRSEAREWAKARLDIEER